MKFYLPQVLLILKIMALPKKKKIWNVNKYKSIPNLGNSHLLKAREVFQPLQPYRSQEILAKRRTSKFK